MGYDSKPPFTNIVFKFTETGYSKPDFGDIKFSFGAPNISDLKASLQVFGIYTSTTYSYLKYCPTITIGYPSSIQIIKLPCIYAGIRDIGGYIYANPYHFDLSAYLFALSNFFDLKAYLKSTIQAYYNLTAALTAVPPFDLYADIHGFEITNLIGSLYGFASKTLNAILGVHSPSDLNAFLNIIEIEDLLAYINGNLLHGTYDLAAKVSKIIQRNNLLLYARLHSYDLFDLQALVAPAYKYDLLATIQSTSTANLYASIYNVSPILLYASVHGFDLKLLSVILNGVYGPGDLLASIYPIHPKDLIATIHGYRGLQIPVDLRATVNGFYKSFLQAAIIGISGVDLTAQLTANGYSLDLSARITPKVVHLKKILLVSLLEHLDLNAVINYSCFASSYTDLTAYLYTIYKKDLQAFIWPWRSNDGYIDLTASINTGIYQVEDKLNVEYVPKHRKYTVDKIVIKLARKYYVCNTIDVLFGNYYFKNLYATIVGILRFSNLSAYIKPRIPRNYSELPEYIKPKSHEVVIKFDGKGREKWRRFVELMFKKDGDDPYHYFYVSGTDKVYRVNRDRHWTVWAYSYISDTEDMIERKAVRTKFIFNTKNYTSIDEAVRDLIDRVSAYREKDLKASIYPYIDRMSNLKANINPQGRTKHRWSKYLGGVIVGT